jgi:hypothetical protein
MFVHFSEKWISLLFKNQANLFWEREKTFLPPFLIHHQRLIQYDEKLQQIDSKRQENHVYENQTVREQREKEKKLKVDYSVLSVQKSRLKIEPFDIILHCKSCPGFILPSFHFLYFNVYFYFTLLTPHIVFNFFLKMPLLVTVYKNSIPR